MNKKSIKFLITITFIFLLAPNVHAFVNKNNAVCDTHISMKQPGVSQGWKVKANICNYSDPSSFVQVGMRSVFTGPTSNFFIKTEAQEAEDEAHVIVEGEVDNGANKDLSVTIQFEKCADPKRQVRVYLTCTAYHVADGEWHPELCKRSEYSKCATKNKRGNCMPGNVCVEYGKYTCPSGYSPTFEGSSICDKTDRYSVNDLTVRIGDNLILHEYDTSDDVLKLFKKIYPQKPKDVTVPRYECKVHYELWCPVYNCITRDETFYACSPEFKVNGATAYCVNPNNSFPSNGSYKTDPNFDVRSCRTSYSTLDCGFANIMIEGNYWAQKNGDKNGWDQAMELAMRLWSDHSNQRGFSGDKIGLSNLISYDSSGSCSTVVRYATTGSVYEKTDSNFYNGIFNAVTDLMTRGSFKDANGNNYIDPSKATSAPFGNIIDISCSARHIACGNTTALKRGFALLYNTVFGNPYMIQHLNELYFDEKDLVENVNLRPTNVKVDTDESDNSVKEGEKKRRVELTFDRTVEVSSENKQFDCSLIEKDDTLPKEKRNYPDLKDEERAYIKQYCTVKVDKLYVVYSDGTKEELENIDVYNNKLYDASKGTLVVESKYFAVCKVNGNKRYKNYRVIVEYPTTKSRYSVRKYTSCEGASNQDLYAFFRQDQVGTGTDSKDVPEEEYSASLNCSNECDNYGVTESKPACQYKDNSIYTGYIKDPSLRCIVNMASDINKGYYDYSDYFGVNTNLCRVFCSDEIDYHIADKITVHSGLSFKYDIKPSGLNLEEKDKLISSVIEEKRTCVSEIYYTKPFITTPDWEGLYGITQEDINRLPGEDKYKTINNWQDLFYVISKMPSSKGSKEENLNQLIFDLYNCNFAQKNQIPSNINIPSNNKIENVYNEIIKKYSKENKYGLDTSTWLDEIKYDGGADYVNKSSNVGESYSDIQMEKLFAGVTVNKIKYCKEGNLKDCLSYKKYNKESLTDQKIKEEYTYENFKESNGVGSTAKAGGGSKYSNTLVPTNDYAMFEVSVQVAFYNNSEFQVESYNGKVMNKNDNTSGLPLIDLDSFIYPMSKNATNRCKEDGDNGTKRCDITQKFSGITTFYRRRQMDEFKQKINSYNEFKCGIDVEPPEVDPETTYSTLPRGSTDTYYRNVDLSNLFPTEASKNKTTNWSMPYGIQATIDIEESAKSINTSKYLEYRVELTPETIKQIKDYNKRKESTGGYLDDSIDHDSCEVSDKKFFNCESKFLQNIRNGRERFGIDANPNINKLDGMSDYTKEQLGIQ